MQLSLFKREYPKGEGVDKRATHNPTPALPNREGVDLKVLLLLQQEEVSRSDGGDLILLLYLLTALRSSS